MLANTNLCVLEELPALRDGSVWVGGFRNIVDHLSKNSGQRVDLDSALDRKDRANITAYVWVQSASSGVRSQLMCEIASRLLSKPMGNLYLI